MQKLSEDYRENVATMDRELRTGKSFDLIKRKLQIGQDELTLYYLDGFVKDGEMLRLMQYFLGLDGLGTGEGAAQAFMERHVPYVEVECTDDRDALIRMILSGAAVMLGSTFSDKALIIDIRTYPARETAEPENDRVMQGARDGFVETLVSNTALIRRRLRDPRLTMQYKNLGGASKTDVVLCYMDGVADPAYVEALSRRLDEIHPASLTLGFQSLAEMLAPRRWYNPFPKIRSTERPDTAAAQLAEGSVLILCDTSPQVMILPTSIFDYLQETDDFYFPPVTGTYLRLLRFAVFLLSFFLSPTWYLMVVHGDRLPAALTFLIPSEPGAMPLILQLFLVEFAIDALKLASMNTPNLLSNSLSVIGGLILGDFAVTIGWLSPDVIFYMALIAIAGFSQQSHELGYAVKFMRLTCLVLTALFDLPGYLIGVALVPILICTNRTVNGKFSYLYPLIPFNARAMKRLLLRGKKDDYTDSAEKDTPPRKRRAK
jgi:stage V sporulation protein AF